MHVEPTIRTLVPYLARRDRRQRAHPRSLIYPIRERVRRTCWSSSKVTNEQRFPVFAETPAHSARGRSSLGLTWELVRQKGA